MKNKINNKINNYPMIIIIVLIFIFLLICISILFFMNIKKHENNENNETCPICPVCPIHLDKKNKNNNENNENNENEHDKSSLIIVDKNMNKNKNKNKNNENTTTSNRDLQVLNNPLFPPLNRTDTNTFNSVVRETRNRNINIPTTDRNDSFRLVGYITNQESNGNIDSGNNNWKLMAREKDRNQSEFYLIPTNNNFDIKIPINQDIVVGQRLRDIYSIPKTIKFNSPLLNKTEYEFIELPKGDFSSAYN